MSCFAAHQQKENAKSLVIILHEITTLSQHVKDKLLNDTVLVEKNVNKKTKEKK